MAEDTLRRGPIHHGRHGSGKLDYHGIHGKEKVAYHGNSVSIVGYASEFRGFPFAVFER